jgi:hypothetical protein
MSGGRKNICSRPVAVGVFANNIFGQAGPAMVAFQSSNECAEAWMSIGIKREVHDK